MRTKYEILNVLFRAEAKSRLIAVTQKLIQEGLVEAEIDYSYKIIYKHLRELLDLGYIRHGMNQLNAKTYYITTAGIKWMKDMEKEEKEE